MVYTSGSTGEPKGVVTTHGALENLVLWHREAYAISPADCATHFAGLGFDAAVWELWTYLSAGARVAIPEEATRTDPTAIWEWLASEGASWSFLPTPLAEMVLGLPLPAFEGARSALCGLLTGGDRLRRRPSTEIRFALINHYGPTENCVVATSGTVSPEGTRELPSIGRPIANVRLYVLDVSLSPVPLGSWGELCLGGVGLARGYLERAARSAESFVPDPWSLEPGGRMYRTGDIGRHLPDGRIEFQGRRDDQVKIRGFRVELGEIEKALERLAGVAAAVVLVSGELMEDRRLIAYAVAEPGAALAWSEMRAALLRSLPDYMVPTALVVLDSMPQTANGKVDRRALPLPSMGSSAAGYIAPRDLVELGLARIWEDLLGSHPPIGARDNFFAVGGHSLLAVRLMSKIELAFGRRLPLAMLFERPSIELLAQALRDRPLSGEAQDLIELRAGNAESAPLVLVHPAGGDVFCYGALARHLETGRGVLGFRARGLDDEREPERQIAPMAARYLQQLRTRQPRGPYFLGGWSLGGMIAWEMARQLEEAGERVLLLALLDTWALPQGAEGDDELELFAEFALHLGLSISGLSLEVSVLSDPSQDDRLESLLAQAKRAGVVPADLGPDRIRSLFRVFAANVEANRLYAPAPGETPVTLWRTEGSLASAAEPTLGWSRLAQGGLEVHAIAGDHFSIVREPQIETVARWLTEKLRLIEEVKP